MIFSQKTTIILLLALQLIFIFIVVDSTPCYRAYLYGGALYITQKSVFNKKGQKPLC